MIGMTMDWSQIWVVCVMLKEQEVFWSRLFKVFPQSKSYDYAVDASSYRSPCREATVHYYKSPYHQSRPECRQQVSRIWKEYTYDSLSPSLYVAMERRWTEAEKEY